MSTPPLCPSDELMWLRTTLVFREVGGWEVVELCEPIADMRHNLEEEIYDPSSIVEVITLAHKYAMQDEQLGFFMYDRSVGNRANFEVDAAESDGYDASIAPDPQPDEAPVDKLEGEPLEEDRIVPFSDDSETVIVDGIAMNNGVYVEDLEGRLQLTRSLRPWWQGKVLETHGRAHQGSVVVGCAWS